MPRYLLATLGADRGVPPIARALRDRGIEVIYLGASSVAGIVNAVVAEDVSLVAIAGELGDLVATLHDAGIDDVQVVPIESLA